MEYIIHPNGTFTIRSGDIQLRGCLPGLDHERIVPEKTAILHTADGDTVRYDLNDKEWIMLHFGYTDGTVRIASEIHTEGKPHVFCPIQHVAVNAAKGIFIQELGLRGQYGYETYDAIYERKAKSTSYGLTALHYSESFLILSCHQHDRFNNIYTYKPTFENGKEMSLSAGFNLEKTQSGAISLPMIRLSEASDLRTGLRREAEGIAAAMGARPARHNTRIWSSWYYNFNFFSQDILEDYLQSFEAYRDTIGFDVIQIDAGYCIPGDWMEANWMWPKGMRGAFDAIRNAGYRAGLWIAPFVVGNRSNLYVNHPDWVVHRPDGRPYAEKTFYEWRKPWPNLSTEYYILDTTHPDAFAYILDVFRQYRSMGVTLFKTDFMLWSMKDTCQVRRFDESQTSVEILRRLLAGIREAIGDDTYLLGCIAPFLPFVGYADGMRIGGDVFSAWSPVHMGMLSKKFPGSSYFNHLYWENDPDVFIVRDFDTDLGYREVESVTLLQAMTGGISGNSSPIHLLSEERRNLLRFVLPRGPHDEVVYPFLAGANPELCILYRQNGKGSLYFFNPGEQAVIKSFDLASIIGTSSCSLYDFHHRTAEHITGGERYLEIPPRGCRLFFFDEEKEIADCPDTIWYQ
jgi:alpha-galactosidase